MIKRDGPLNITYETQGTYGEVSDEHRVQIGFLLQWMEAEGAGRERETVRYETGVEASLALPEEGVAELVWAHQEDEAPQGYRYDVPAGTLQFLQWNPDDDEITETDIEPDTPEGAEHFRDMHSKLLAYVNEKQDDALPGMEPPRA